MTAQADSGPVARPLAIGLNRWDWGSVSGFVDSVMVAEAAGIDVAFLPVNPIAVPDPYVLFSAAAMRTSRIRFGPLLETPILRSAPVAAGSIATLDELSDGRAMLVYGIGDTAVRMLGRSPARIARLEHETRQARALLSGEAVEVGGARPARLRHARPVPVWIAASGPRTLRMAGGAADGVFLRVGTHPANIATAVAEVHAGASAAGRDPSTIGLGLIVHTCQSQDPATVRAITRAMAAGFYEYAPALFDPPGFVWNGAPIEELKRQVYPDFHHARDLVAAGDVVSFLDDEVAESFSFHGSTGDIVDQIARIRAAVPEIEIIVPHPVPMPDAVALARFVQWLGDDLRPAL